MRGSLTFPLGPSTRGRRARVAGALAAGLLLGLTTSTAVALAEEPPALLPVVTTTTWTLAPTTVAPTTEPPTTSPPVTVIEPTTTTEAPTTTVVDPTTSTTEEPTTTTTEPKPVQHPGLVGACADGDDHDNGRGNDKEHDGRGCGRPTVNPPVSPTTTTTSPPTTIDEPTPPTSAVGGGGSVDEPPARPDPQDSPGADGDAGSAGGSGGGTGGSGGGTGGDAGATFGAGAGEIVSPDGADGGDASESAALDLGAGDESVFEAFGDADLSDGTDLALRGQLGEAPPFSQRLWAALPFGLIVGMALVGLALGAVRLTRDPQSI